VKADWFRTCAAVLELATGVLAITTYLHHMRLLGLFTVLTTILAALLGRAIAGWVRAFVFSVFCHTTLLLSG
jgi:hypothetical protein